jgi:hypothetical protein
MAFLKKVAKIFGAKAYAPGPRSTNAKGPTVYYARRNNLLI